MTLSISGRGTGCAALLLGLILAACAAPAPGPTPAAAPTYPPMPTLTPVVETPLPPAPAPSTTRTTTASGDRLFSTLAQTLPFLDFAPLVPAYIPDDLPLARVSLSDQGSLLLYYAFSGQSPESSPRLLSVTQTRRGEPVTADTISNPEHGAVDALTAEVRGQPGFFYWTYAEGGRPSYRLAWREQNVNVTLALTGSWNAAGSGDPHSLDPLLAMIASGLTVDTTGWQAVTASGQALPVAFSIPAEWKPSGADAFAGPDGFARLEAFDGPDMDAAAACEWEANAHPEWYGLRPSLELLPASERQDRMCLVHPDSGQAAVLIPNFPGAKPRLLILRTSARHGLAISRSIKISFPVAATALPENRGTPSLMPAGTLNWQGLAVDIYPLGRLASESPDVFLTAPDAVLDKHRSARELPAVPADRVEISGRTLSLQPVTISHPFVDNGQVQVSADGQIIYRFNMLAPEEARAARLLAWQDQWVLNIHGILVINGEIANRKLGYDRIDDWMLLAGKPYYLFEKAGLTRISYNGAVFPQVYNRMLEDYPHGSNERMAWFYVLKDGQVLYIEMGRY